jgi:signal transduction histidine kinase
LSVRRFFARSLSVQIALVMAGALLIASAVNFAILMGERSRAGLNEQSGPAIGRFVERVVEAAALPPAELQRLVEVGRGGRYAVARNNPIDMRNLSRDDRLEQRLRRALDEAGVQITEVRASTRLVERPERWQMGGREVRGTRQGGDTVPGGGGPDGAGPRVFGPGDGPLPDGRGGFGIGPPDGPGGPPPGMIRMDGRDGPPQFRRAREIVLSAQLPEGRWITGFNMSPQPPGGGEVFRLLAGTVITFLFVLVAALWLARRLSRPLNDLTRAAANVGSATNPEEVAVRGPSDVRQTLEAFNAMSRRVSQLLGEKDVMLGALGHDLRTPLASLRIRLETMEPESERNKAVRTIEEASQLLEDILELARQGRSKEPVRTIDISVLVEDIVEDYSETGAPVTLAFSQKAPVACRPVLFRRALRNLIDNAISYGERARLSVTKVGNEAFVRIEDDGPGMSDDALKSAADPFYRGDTSRNRTTGGAGLGLTLADAIAKAHGGALVLENHKPHGLVATIKLPTAVPVPPPASPPAPTVS